MKFVLSESPKCIYICKKISEITCITYYYIWTRNTVLFFSENHEILMNEYLSCSELRLALMNHGEMKLTKQEVEEMIDLVDIDNDDRIKYSEFVKLFTEHIDL